MGNGNEVRPCVQWALLGVGLGDFQSQVEEQARQGDLGCVPGSSSWDWGQALPSPCEVPGPLVVLAASALPCLGLLTP